MALTSRMMPRVSPPRFLAFGRSRPSAPMPRLRSELVFMLCH